MSSQKDWEAGFDRPCCELCGMVMNDDGECLAAECPEGKE